MAAFFKNVDMVNEEKLKLMISKWYAKSFSHG